MKSEAITKWFPLGVSLDLVLGAADKVALAVATELNRFIHPNHVTVERQRFASLDALFSSVKTFTNTPTILFVIPTQTSWTAMWNNSFLCDGYDSLCHCLTLNHGFVTLHWASSDTDGIFQAGTQFIFRSIASNELRTRSVYCAREDKKWIFHQGGDPLPEEDPNWYLERPKRKRLDEARLMALFAKLEASPWEDDFHDLSQPVTRLARVNYPSTIHTEDYDYIVKRVKASNNAAAPDRENCRRS